MIYAMVVGRNYDEQAPHVLHCNMISAAVPMQWARWDKPLPADCTGLFICPGFNLPGGKYVLATKARVMEAHFRKLKIAVYMCDFELCKAWAEWFFHSQIKHIAVTNFSQAWRVWAAKPDAFVLHTFYNMDQMVKCPNVQPKWPVAYVGWPKKSRLYRLRQIKYDDLVLLGFGADKQDNWPAAMCEANTAWPFLGELFTKAAWHLCISDKEHAWVRSSVSRPIEAWQFNRPCAFHTSFIESRRELDLTGLKDWTFETNIELYDIVHRHCEGGVYDLEKLAEIARYQSAILSPMYYQDKPNPEIRDYFR